MTSIRQSNKAVQSKECINVNNATETISNIIKKRKKELTRYDNIIKSPNDKRNYRGLILENKLKVLLVSDPTTDTSAASLDVNVGYFCDPEEIPGLAHFCEHMLFLGTSKYPEVNDYDQYLSQNGGSSNAETCDAHTNYYFDVDPDKLEGALDRFSQFFISPLFTEAITEKEMNAVHSEHEKNLSDDTWRVEQLDQSSSDPKHPFSKFGTGNRDTLDIIPKQKNIDVRQELLKFHNTWYSANIMSLSVLGKESLDELENMVVEMFSDIENKNIEAPKWKEHPFNEEHFQNEWFIVPVKDVRNLNIIFPTPDLHDNEHFRAEPASYWSHLIGHEAKGSLLSALKEKGWCSSLTSGQRYFASGFNFFDIIVDLTKEGLKHIDDIIMMSFQYINLLKEKGPIKEIFTEYSDIASMNFRFKEKSSPVNCVNNSVTLLHKYPIEEIFSASNLITEWRPDLINEVGSYLVPENIRVQVVAKAFESKADSVEPWYGTKYKREKIPAELIEKWKNAGTNDVFHLPEKNEFIPTVFDIKPYEKVDEFPVIIEDSPFVRLWFKQDDKFLLPKGTMIFNFVSPFAYMDPLNANMTYLFAELLEDSLNEYSYNAELAGLKWELSNTVYGLSLTLSGYDHKLNILLEKILKRMVNFTVDENRFEIWKENYVRDLKNFEAEEPSEQLAHYRTLLLSEQAWEKKELLNACSILTVERLRQFISLFLSKIHIEFLIHGNITKSEAIQVAKLVESVFVDNIKDLTPLLPRQLLLNRELQLPNGCHFLYEVKNKHHKSSCTEVFYQSGPVSTENNMLLKLFEQIISEPCYNILRTKEQLGYDVSSGIRRVNGVQGLRVTVQGSRHPQYLEERIDCFIDTMKEYITTMSEKEFNKHKKSLATQLLVKPKKMKKQSFRYWGEISAQQYNFDRTNIEVAYLKTITREQIIDFYKEVVDKNSPQRRKLCIHVISTVNGGPSLKGMKGKKSDVCVKNQESNINGSPENGPVRINDILEFKTNYSLHPLGKPFGDVPRKGLRYLFKV